ncbi:hypothetical protein [Pseudoalteromonas fuliginea]|uniref:Uncharacterized protein n=1 Tax=Pseudoalteromonas fuliginea TaxID=1872678 RepID=A0ABQ6RE98_9GAMM|nr:hypothetical protein [Pseudoalteromonas fuliginea]KAA1151392.1 hypothetical protein EU509_16010 [Pseudoalteromonas fuliginea]KAA1165859.1 hypothetical protein EUZ79_16000 [Pseudoalteromonas fuliginea]
MRRLQNLDKEQQTSFASMFPELDKVVSVEDTDKYRFMAVSVFDHWLSKRSPINYYLMFQKKSKC